MKSVLIKLLGTRGETLAETLVSIVILGLSITLMLTMIMTSTQITKQTRDADEALMNELNFAEEQPEGSGVSGEVTITCTGGASGSITVNVDLYADTETNSDDPLISYSPN